MDTQVPSEEKEENIQESKGRAAIRARVLLLNKYFNPSAF